MKILYLCPAIVVVMLLIIPVSANATMYGGHLNKITIQLPFMKTNSNGTIVMNYTVYYPHNSTINTKLGLYDNKLQNDDFFTLHDLSIKAEPASINLLENNIVAYTLEAKNNVKGVYVISGPYCWKLPLVVGLNESEILPNILFRFFLPVHCFAVPSDAPELKIVNYEGIILKNVTIAIDKFSPMRQIQLGSNSTDVKCMQGFDLIIKNEDNMPACVKPDAAQKLVERGWGILIGTANNIASTNICGQFYTAPGNRHNSNTVPVLLMKSNSTACARLTFTIVSNYKDCNGHNCQHIIALGSTLHVGNLYYEKHDNMFSVSAGKDYTSSFNITTIPNEIDLANYAVGSNYTVTYVIKPLPNATGFYDQSIPKLACERYLLAVGYAVNQVNASDFSYIDTSNPPCVSSVNTLTRVEISGMDYKEVTLSP
jgi:hypothetical protein